MGSAGKRLGLGLVAVLAAIALCAYLPVLGDTAGDALQGASRGAAEIVLRTRAALGMGEDPASPAPAMSDDFYNVIGQVDGAVSPLELVGEENEPEPELESGWSNAFSYDARTETFSLHEKRQVSAFDAEVQADFDVAYPVLTGAGPAFEQVNEALRTAALRQATRLYLDPDEGIVSYMTDPEVSATFAANTPVMRGDVSHVITYASEDLISVCFDEHYFVRSIYGEYSGLRCVTASLRTGEVFAPSSMLTVNDAVANAFVDAWVQQGGEDEDGDGVVSDAECFAVSVMGRDDLVHMLRGEGDEAWRVSPSFFVNASGRLEMAVTYQLSREGKIARGWVTAELPDDIVRSARGSSEVWSYLDV